MIAALSRNSVTDFIMLTIIIADSRGRNLDAYLDDENILVTFYSGAILAYIAERAIDVITRFQPDMIVVMAGINDITILNRTSCRVRLAANNSSILFNLLTDNINHAKRRILSVLRDVKIAFGASLGST